jgi:hypothetical protein
VNRDSGPSRHLPEGPKEHPTVVIDQHDGLPTVPPRQYVIHRTGASFRKLGCTRELASGHEARSAVETEDCKNSHLTLFSCE